MFPWLENGEGLGAGIQLISGGVDTARGVLAVGDISGVGDATGEGVKKILEGDGDGEYDIGADPGEYEGLSDGDDEKGSKSGGNEEGKCDADCLSFPWLTSPWILGVLAAFAGMRSCLLYAISPCWPLCRKLHLPTNNSLVVASVRRFSLPLNSETIRSSGVKLARW